MSLEKICLGLLRIRKIVIRMTTRMKQKKISVKKKQNLCMQSSFSLQSLKEELHLRKSSSRGTAYIGVGPNSMMSSRIRTSPAPPIPKNYKQCNSQRDLMKRP